MDATIPTPLAAARAAATKAVFSFPNVPRGGSVEYRCRVGAYGDIEAIVYDDGYQGGPLEFAPGEGEDTLLRGVSARHDGDDHVAAAKEFVQGLSDRAGALDRFDELAGRLVGKMKLSQTKVPGFMVGLSGTDSTLVFLLLHEAARRMGMADRVVGIHYVNPERRRPTWFEASVVPWLRGLCPEASVLVEAPLGGNHDQQRWADLNLRALNEIATDADGRTIVRSLPEGRNYWVAGCTNATEQELGKFSTMSRGVSLMPIIKVRKSKVLAMCVALGVPAIAIENAKLPDCLCGRDELAAQNIGLIDDILDHRLRVADHDPVLVDKMLAYVRDLIRDNGFKHRTPYLL
jgi:NH3-dependent NAD+ synthetase